MEGLDVENGEWSGWMKKDTPKEYTKKRRTYLWTGVDLKGE